MKLITNFQKQVCKSPHKIAISTQKKEISYTDLDFYSSQLAENIMENGFGPGQRAAIYMNKSIDYIICMLAVLKSKGAYVCVDFSSPSQRVSYILENSQVSFFFTHKEKNEVAESFITPYLEEVYYFSYEKDFPSYQRVAYSQSQKTPLHENELAFLLYTSGSTGVPKGVQISNQNAFSFVDWAQKEMNIGKVDRVLNLAGFHFDLSVFDIYLSLSSGATLIIFPQRLAINPFELGQWIEEKKITVLYCVPSILTLMVTSGAIKKHDLSSLRYLLFAGEVFPTKYLKVLCELLPDTRFYNLYGPTETNVCTFYEVKKKVDSQRVEPVPIGLATSNALLFPMNKEGKPLKKGEVGELFVQGDCVTPGYWNYEDQRNRENHTKGRHATGDLVSWENENLVFRGRVDNQVKLNGYRIELGEIENILVNHPGIEECAALLFSQYQEVSQEVHQEVSKLVVFFTGQDIPDLKLKQYCFQYLPSYMIPQSFRHMEQLPKNQNGKIDRLQLRNSNENPRTSF